MTDPSVWRVHGPPLRAGGTGPLAGRRVAVKDVLAVRGQLLGAGNPTWLAAQEPRVADAAAVAALVGAGAELTGIAQTDEFAYSLAGTNAHHGTPPNPAAPGRISGGSTSGPASAVALGEADIGLGTDTAGSIRVPASYQGLYGLRTTHGALSTAGVLPLAPSFDAVGWLARDADLLGQVAEVVLPGARRAPLTRGVVVPALVDLAEPAVAAAFSGAVAGLGLAAVDRADLDAEVLATWAVAFRTVQGHEAWAAHGAWVDAHPGALGPDVAARFAVAARVDDASCAAARATLADACVRLRALLAPGTALLLPAASSPAPPRSAPPGAPEIERARAATLGLTCLAGVAGAPAVSLPLLRVDGAPVGLSVVAAPGADRDLTDLAATISRPPRVSSAR
ncbi:amidase [Actinomycetospora sp. NBRC 106375]|uniref:amidase n=1 Tax=Actinomycetospora sp. NBRC 106375 TaxID=3032207 RepID=UPI00249FC0D5|nr:amidase [Actinomycetospora sp. NBRC 106375]GLZ45587.1 amidase [Actinomycetospora sp. NBRC 106375]